MAGYVSSWQQSFSTTPTPCITSTTGSTTFSSCVVWLLVGLVIGSIRFQKKGNQQ